MLGVSRQHVVDLCDRGDLRCVRVGTHRRIPRSRVVDLTTARVLTREQEKSLWLHRALLATMVTEPDEAIAKGRENLRRWRDVHRPDGRTAAGFTRWERVLDQGIDAVMEVASSTSDEACEMRQNSPFAGLLPQQTRRQTLHAFTEHWARRHEPAPAR